MKKKIIEKNKAINLRKQGFTINKIAKELNVSKSSVSLWLQKLPEHHKLKSDYLNKIKKSKIDRLRKIKEERDLANKLEQLKRFEENNVLVAQVDEHHPSNKERSMWKIEKIINKGDYLYAVVKNHPYASKYGYVLLHRIIIENHLKRLLNSNEIVHHKNGDRFDNRIENLEVMNSKEHNKLRSKEQGKKMVLLKCPNCKKLFELPFNKLSTRFGKKFRACSKSCGTSFSYALRNERTIELERAVSENIVRIFKRFHDNSEQTIDNWDA